MAYSEKAQERAIKRAEDWSKQDQLELNTAVQAMLTQPQSRRYLWWLLTIGKAIGQNPFTGNALSTSFECGQQNVGQQIMAHLLEVSPEGFLMMLQERENERRERTNSGNTGGGDDYPSRDADEPGTYS